VRIPVAIVGASGYTGAELCRLLAGHPNLDLVAVYAKNSAGQPLAKVFPQFAGRLEHMLEAFDPAKAAHARLVFSALPHGESGAVCSALVEYGVFCVDLSADFRLRDVAEHRVWYGEDHAGPRRAQAVYGLPERYREKLFGARLIAAPGCYPTATILATAPLLAAGLISPEGIVVDAKSGVSGAGRQATTAVHFSEAGEGIRPYKVAGTHRHTGEIEQELGAVVGKQVRVTFTPHLVPMSRGILACVYATPTDPGRPAAAYHDALAEAYRREPFVTVLPPGQLPDTAFVRGSNYAHVNVAYDERARRVVAMSAIDNLVKGASGQAVQCANLALGLPEVTGLDGVAFFP
jgi:N-acetyl-gamma-glutamyl-phosphate reductase